MASILKRPNGTYVVRFVNERSRRKTLSLGNLKSERQASRISDHVENILTARQTSQQMDPSTAAWIASLNNKMRVRLESVGLVEPISGDVRKEETLGELLDNYIAKRTDAKRGTKLVLGHTRRNLLAFFGSDKPIASLTAGDAKDFERYLRTGARKMRYSAADVQDALSMDTVRKRIGNCKQFFQDAIDRKVLSENPFAKLKSTVFGNRERDFFITHDMTYRLLDVCPDSQWRLIIALSRFGGLRCPSEHLGLKLEDIDWERDRIRVRSPKTEHHDGKAYRFIPLFAELRPYLLDVVEQAAPGTEYLITRYRDAAQNLRTTFQKIIKRANLTPWPKLFHNLRASRQTELEEKFPTHVVCAWIGNSPQIAKRHYLQVTEEHFTTASGARSIFVATHALQSAASDSEGCKNTAENRSDLQSVVNPIAEEGFELSTKPAGKRGFSGARSTVVATAPIPAGADSRLARVVARWYQLSEETRKEIFRLVD